MKSKRSKQWWVCHVDLLCHRPVPRKGQKSWSWERLAQSCVWHGLEETAAVSSLSSSQQAHRACSGEPQTASFPLKTHCSHNIKIRLLTFPRVTFRTLKNPKTGTRQCSSRYTESPVGLSASFSGVCDRFFTAPDVVLSPCACCVCYVTLCCLSTTVLRVHWGKPLSPHLHFPRELWHSGEI